jgi:hypothetical protein
MTTSPETVRELRTAISELSSYETLMRVFESIQSSFKPDTLEREAKTLHTARPSRTLFKKPLTPTNLWAAQTKDIEVRSRLVEIRVSITTHRDVLLRCIKLVRGDVSTQYSSVLKRFASNADGRSAMLDRFVRQPLELADRINATIDVLDVLIKDIDQTAFGIRNGAELLKIMLGPRASEATV